MPATCLKWRIGLVSNAVPQVHKIFATVYSFTYADLILKDLSRILNDDLSYNEFSNKIKLETSEFRFEKTEIRRVITAFSDSLSTKELLEIIKQLDQTRVKLANEKHEKHQTIEPSLLWTAVQQRLMENPFPEDSVEQAYSKPGCK